MSVHQKVTSKNGGFSFWWNVSIGDGDSFFSALKVWSRTADSRQRGYGGRTDYLVLGIDHYPNPAIIWAVISRIDQFKTLIRKSREI